MMLPNNSNLDVYCNTARLLRIRVWALRVAWLTLAGLALVLILVPSNISSIAASVAFMQGDARSLTTAIMAMDTVKIITGTSFWCMLWFGIAWLITYLLALREEMARLAERRRKAVTR